jgi:hypothetical protein
MSFVRILMSVPDSAQTMTQILQLKAAPVNQVDDENMDKLIGDMIDGSQRSYTKISTGLIQAFGTITLAAMVAGDTITINGVVFTAETSGATGNQFNVGASDTITAANAAKAINASVTANVLGVVFATSASNVVTITAVQPGLQGNMNTLAISAHGAVASASTTAGPALLGTSASYAVLATTAVTNTGNTVLVGNLGAGASVSGFPPGTYTGVENVANAAYTQAHTDAGAAVTTLLARTPVTDISSTDLGGDTLVAGNYNAAVAGTWSAGNLTLDAAGNPNAIFVLSFGTSLTMPASANVILKNGAQANNVYFVTGTTFTFGANDTVNGTILAGTSVTFASASVLNGRALTYGPSGTTVTFPSAGAVSALPLSGNTASGSAGIEAAINYGWAQ